MPALNVPSAKQLATDRLRTMIYSGELQPGDWLSIVDLANEFGVSRTPVREAAWQLSSEGLVTISPRVGVFVREIETQEVLDVYALKIQLEPLMAKWAIERGTDEESAQIASSSADLLGSFEHGDLDGYVAILQLRRELFLKMARSAVLTDALSVIDGRVRLLRRRNLAQRGSMAASIRQHLAITAAVVAGDSELGFNAMLEHMRDARERVIRLFSEGAGSGDTFAVGRSDSSQATPPSAAVI